MAGNLVTRTGAGNGLVENGFEPAVTEVVQRFIARSTMLGGFFHSSHAGFAYAADTIRRDPTLLGYVRQFAQGYEAGQAFRAMMGVRTIGIPPLKTQRQSDRHEPTPSPLPSNLIMVVEAPDGWKYQLVWDPLKTLKSGLRWHPFWWYGEVASITVSPRTSGNGPARSEFDRMRGGLRGVYGSRRFGQAVSPMTGGSSATKPPELIEACILAEMLYGDTKNPLLHRLLSGVMVARSSLDDLSNHAALIWELKALAGMHYKFADAVVALETRYQDEKDDAPWFLIEKAPAVAAIHRELERWVLFLERLGSGPSLLTTFQNVRILEDYFDLIALARSYSPPASVDQYAHYVLALNEMETLVRMASAGAPALQSEIARLTTGAGCSDPRTGGQGRRRFSGLDDFADTRRSVRKNLYGVGTRVALQDVVLATPEAIADFDEAMASDSRATNRAVRAKASRRDKGGLMTGRMALHSASGPIGRSARLSGGIGRGRG